jgi:hypothetical protein
VESPPTALPLLAGRYGLAVQDAAPFSFARMDARAATEYKLIGTGIASGHRERDWGSRLVLAVRRAGEILPLAGPFSLKWTVTRQFSTSRIDGLLRFRAPLPVSI